MVLNAKKRILKTAGLGKKFGVYLTFRNILTFMIVFDQVTRFIDSLEEQGHIKGNWNSGKQFTLIKKINSKIVSFL